MTFIKVTWDTSSDGQDTFLVDSFLSLKNGKVLLCSALRVFYIHLSAFSLLMKRSTWSFAHIPLTRSFKVFLTQNLFLFLCIDQWWFPVSWSLCTLRRIGEEALWIARTNYWILLLFHFFSPFQSPQMLSKILFLLWILMQAELTVISLFVFKPHCGFTLVLWNKKLVLIFSSVVWTCFLGTACYNWMQ